LGVGTGWNPVEYAGLGADFASRGRRMDEQIRLLRLLWRDPVVRFKGEFESIDGAGINPLPTNPDIPIWMGGTAPRALRRIGRLGDGWFPLGLPRVALREGMDLIREAARDAGRPDATIGMQCAIAETGDLDAMVAAARRFEESGATHIAFATQDAGFTSMQQHLDSLTRFAEAM
ncbi:MAG: LLM class flavin-dependent oxidoreductase, partial [Dehalococcoidia bacterium]